ncbi:MAG: hypothetical protein ABIZ80_13010 [Bryobacteraceae bacterium]
MPTGTRNSSSGDTAEPAAKSLAPKRKTRAKKKVVKSTERPPVKKQRTSKSKLVDKAIACFEKKLDSEDLKATVGDFIRLLQLQKELEGEITREIKITWVDPGGTEPV